MYCKCIALFFRLNLSRVRYFVGVLQPDDATPLYSRIWFLILISFAAYVVLFVVVFILVRKYREGRGHVYNGMYVYVCCVTVIEDFYVT